MNDPLHSILIIAVMAVVTALLRCLPFFISAANAALHLLWRTSGLICRMR